MAFYPIYTSTASTGEYAGSLFVVVFISLIFSWVLSQTVTPLMCMVMLPDPDKDANEDIYAGGFYQKFRSLLAFSIKYRVMFMGAMVGLLFLSVLGFRYVPVLFFPEYSRLQVMIDYWEPEGNRIEQVASHLQGIEDKLLTLSQVESVSSFIGQGPPRFYLPVNPETPHSSYAQLIVNTETLDDVDTVIADITPWFAENYPDAFIRVRKYPVGSFDDWKFEARFSGPATADPEILRSLADQGGWLY